LTSTHYIAYGSEKEETMTTKLADSKGRIALGARFANVTFIVDDANPGQIVLKPAVAIPAQEAWLYQNQTAVDLVRRGLEQARNGKFSKTPPDLDADAALTESCDD
jgi:hypothetical protein